MSWKYVRSMLNNIKSHLAVCVSGGTQSFMGLLKRLLRLWPMMRLQVSISDLYCSQLDKL